MTGWLIVLWFRLLRLAVRPARLLSAASLGRVGASYPSISASAHLACATRTQSLVHAVRSGLHAASTTAIMVGAGALLAVTLASQAAASAPENTLPPGAGESTPGGGATILVLGDSISAGYGIQREQGWVSQLSERLGGEGAPWQVVNASLSGETTGGGLARLPDALETHEPEIVIVELGGNDGLRGYPIDRIRSNLSRMVALAREAGSRVLLVGMQIPPNYGPRYTRAFADVFHQVADEHDVPLVPFLLEDVALTPELMQQDGIHPSAQAQNLLLDTLWPHLLPLLTP